MENQHFSRGDQRCTSNRNSREELEINDRNSEPVETNRARYITPGVNCSHALNATSSHQLEERSSNWPNIFNCGPYSAAQQHGSSSQFGFMDRQIPLSPASPIRPQSNSFRQYRSPCIENIIGNTSSVPNQNGSTNGFFVNGGTNGWFVSDDTNNCLVRSSNVDWCSPRSDNRSLSMTAEQSDPNGPVAEYGGTNGWFVSDDTHNCLVRSANVDWSSPRSDNRLLSMTAEQSHPNGPVAEYGGTYGWFVSDDTNNCLVRSAHVDWCSRQSDNSSLSMAVANSNPDGRVAAVRNPGDFRNPLMDSYETESSAFLRNLKIENGVGNTVCAENSSAKVAHFLPQFRSSYVQTRRTTTASEGNAVLTSLSNLVETVIFQPGRFNDLAVSFFNHVELNTLSDETVKETVDLIVYKGISEDNFSYFGARLCDELMTTKILNNFRTLFFNQLQAEFDKAFVLFETAMDDNVKRIHGVVAFMAEIFSHITVRGDPPLCLGRALGRFLKDLITKSKNNVAFVCKMLKLTGAKLRYVLYKCEKDMRIYDKIFVVLNNYVNEGQLDERTLSLTSSVLHLKNSNWGRTDLNTQTPSIGNPIDDGDQWSILDQNHYSNEMVFFYP